MASDSLFTGLAKRAGLVYRDGGQPLPGGPDSSRYARGLGVSPRLDQDVDALLARVADLEARLARLEAERAKVRVSPGRPLNLRPTERIDQRADVRSEV